jgi:4'-phosphopantetheinyl transferase
MKVHWLTQKRQQVPDSLYWLHPDEKEHYSQFRFTKKQQDWLLGRWTAKQVLIRYLRESKPEISMNDVAILPATDGAPEVFYKGEPIKEIISLSHSNGVGFCVIGPSGIKLGCDLELIEPRSPAFIKDYFTGDERFIIHNTKKEEIPLMANLIWSAKESVLKALRTGLSMDTRQVHIDCSPINEQGIWNAFRIEVSNSDQRFYGCWLKKSGFVYTMVGNQQDFELVSLDERERMI